jgi:two-component system chemotaxis sensor kinase CheA
MMDEARLRRAFLEEAQEMLDNLNRLLVDLEQDTGNADLVNEIFRHVHSLKSESALMGYTKLSEVAHRTEDIFDLLKSGRLALERPVIDAVFGATDLIGEMIARVSSGGGDAEFAVDPILAQLDRSAGRSPSGPRPGAGRGPAAAAANGAATPSSPNQAAPAVSAELDESQRRSLEEGRARRERLYRLTCVLEQSCPMKLPRAYLIRSNLEMVSNVIRAIPSPDLAEDGAEMDDDAFSRLVVYVTTTEEEEALRQAVDVDEVERFEVVRVEYDEILADRGATPQSAPEPKAPVRARPAPEHTSIRVETKKLNDIWSLVGQLVITKGRLVRLQEHAPQAEGDLRSEIELLGDDVGGIAEGLQQAMMETRMVPVSVLFDKLPRLIRDLCKQVGKEVDLVTRGEGTEIDRTFVEALSDPLTHLIRNSLDHGVEPPEERLRAGKPARGRITASAYQEGGKVVLEISDDGRGLDLVRIRRKAERLGLIGPGEGRTDTEIVEMIFRPGFSTAEAVTDLSGRGVGMDVVATRVRETLRGEVQVRSESGSGTRFSIVLPLTLTILNTLVVGLQGRQYAIPITNVDETVKLPVSELTPGGTGGQVARHRGEEIPVVFLSDLLGRLPTQRETYDAVIVTHRGHRAFLVVDELVEEQDVVIKPADDIINPNRLFSGVSVLGDGRILLILSTTFIQDGWDRGAANGGYEEVV